MRSRRAIVSFATASIAARRIILVFGRVIYRPAYWRSDFRLERRQNSKGRILPVVAVLRSEMRRAMNIHSLILVTVRRLSYLTKSLLVRGAANSFLDPPAVDGQKCLYRDYSRTKLLVQLNQVTSRFRHVFQSNKLIFFL